MLMIEPDRCSFITGTTARQVRKWLSRSIAKALPPVVERDVLHVGGRSGDARVVDEDVDAAEVGDSRTAPGVDRICI